MLFKKVIKTEVPKIMEKEELKKSIVYFLGIPVYKTIIVPEQSNF